MIRAEQRDAVRHDRHRAVAELRQGSRHAESATATRAQVRVPPDLAQRDDHAHLVEQAQLLQEERLAPPHFERRWLVGGRRAARRGRDVGASKLEPVTGMEGRWAVGEARVVERAKEPIAAPIAGEHAARAIATMSGRRQTHDEHARARIAESGQWLRPVLLTSISLRRVRRHRLAVTNEARTQPTRDDSIDEPPEARRNGRLGASHAQKALRALTRSSEERESTDGRLRSRTKALS